MDEKIKENTVKEEEKTRITKDTSKDLSREARKKLREKRRAETSPATKMTLYLWFVLFFAGVVTFFDGWCTLAITLAMGNVGEQIDILQQNQGLFEHFGISNNPVMMGIILSIAGSGVVLAVSFKYFVDKYGRRPLTLITAVCFITFTTLTGLTPRGTIGLVIFLILRIFANYFLSADIVTIIMAEESPNHLRGRLIGVVLATNTVGGFICGIIQMIGIEITLPGGIELTTWQSLFFLSSFGFIFIIPMFFFLKETWRFKGMKKYEDWRKKKGLTSKVGWSVPLRKQYARAMILGCIMGFLITLIYFAQVTYFGLYFAKELNMSARFIGLASLPLMLSAGIGYYVAGPLMDKWGRIPTIHRFGCTTLVGGAIFSWPTVFVVGDIGNHLLMALVIFGGMMGIVSLTVLMTAATIVPLEMLPTHIRSTAMGWMGAIARGAMIVSPFLMMYGAESLGGLGLTYQAMFALMGMPLTTLLFTAYLLAPESKGRVLEEIVVTEVYTKQKRVHDREYKRPYYYFALGLIVFFFTGLIYGNTGDGTFQSVVSIVSFYTIVCLGCFLVVVWARKVMSE
ncbi:MAG: MFS transporter [Candidatus Helarchaeota archaeon]|nr:MFS transporter [Candidatus Helarchaeota archaeon]